jgi:hypothetical protein
MQIFNLFKINTDFLNINPSSRKNNNYKKAATILKNIPVVYDVAERGVKLIEIDIEVEQSIMTK